MNAIERVAFVLRFINTKIDRLSPRATGTLRKDLIAFLDWPAAANMAQGLAEALTPSRIAEMQSDSVYIFKEIAIDLRWFLRKGVSIYRDAVQEPWQLPGGLMVSASVDEKTREPNGHTIHIWLGEDHLLFNILQPGQAHVQCVSPDLQTSFRVTLAAALMSAGVPAVRLCPVCDRVFVGSGKRQFCTLRCKSIEMGRRFRERKIKRERERARENYEKRVRKKPQMENVPSGLTWLDYPRPRAFTPR